MYSLTTALYPSHSPFLGTDPVFATKKSLICELREEKDQRKWVELGWEKDEVARRCKEAQAQSLVSTNTWLARSEETWHEYAANADVGTGLQDKVQERVWKWNYAFVLASEEEVKALKAKQAKAAN